MHTKMRLPVIALSMFIVTCSLSFPASTHAEDQRGIKQITSIEGITEYRLDNGLKVLLFPDNSKPTVTINLTIFVGSRHEGYGEAGMAHLLEHMLFKGTPDHPDIPKVLKTRGARMNGTTWLDRTNYYETLPASDDNLEFAIRLEADRMINSYIKAEDLASEMTVVRNEFEQGENSPSRVLHQRMMSAAFDWHNYGRSTIGNRADIERVPVDNLKKFYKKYYQPDNGMLVVAGKFDPEKALAYVQRYFGPIPRPERKLSNTYTEEPAQDGERVVTLRRAGDVAAVGVLHHIPSGPHPDYVSIDVLENILTTAPSGRLYKALVETQKAAQVGGFAFSLHDPGVLQLFCSITRGNDPQPVLDTMLDEIRKVVNEGVTEEEIERAKTKLLKQVELATSNSAQFAIDLSEWAAQGDWRLYFLYRDRLEKVSKESVNEVAKKYLKRNNRTVGIYYPTEGSERVKIPPTPDIAKMIGDYKGREMIAQGEAFNVSPENIEKRTTRKSLPTGLSVSLLPKKTRGEEVVFRLTMRYGNETSLQGLATACEILPSMLKRGTSKYTRQELDDLLDQKRIQASFSGDAGQLTLTIKTKRTHFEEAVKLAIHMLREPTLPKAEFKILKQQQLAYLQAQLRDPQTLATITARRHIDPYPKGHPRHVMTVEEQIEAINALKLSDVKRLYDDFLGMDHAQVAIVGDFDPDAIEPLLAELSGNWRAKEQYTYIPRTRGTDAPGGSQSIETPDKANATYFGAVAFPLQDTHEDYPALVIGNYVFGGGGALSSRLGDRVRQNEGLSYGIGSGFAASSRDPRAVLYAYAICNPANMPKVKIAIAEEMTRLLEEGITEEELKNAKQAYLQQQEVSRTSDTTLAQTLVEVDYLDRTMEHYTELEAAIEELTVEDVNATLKKQIDPKRFFVAMAGDFANVEVTAPAPEPKPANDE